VLAAYPLPPFPTDMTDTYLDAHFSFAIGQPSG
jgi:colicin import membrane protein